MASPAFSYWPVVKSEVIPDCPHHTLPSDKRSPFAPDSLSARSLLAAVTRSCGEWRIGSFVTEESGVGTVGTRTRFPWSEVRQAWVLDGERMGLILDRRLAPEVYWGRETRNMPFSDLLDRREMQRKEYRTATLAAVRECCRLFAREFPCTRVWIFGSLITGRFHRQSDIDIAAEGLPEPLFFKAHAYLMRCLPAGHEIDLKPFEALAAPVRQRIETEGELLVG